jgi:hypothetical protein
MLLSRFRVGPVAWDSAAPTPQTLALIDPGDVLRLTITPGDRRVGLT